EQAVGDVGVFGVGEGPDPHRHAETPREVLEAGAGRRREVAVSVVEGETADAGVEPVAPPFLAGAVVDPLDVSGDVDPLAGSVGFGFDDDVAGPAEPTEERGEGDVGHGLTLIGIAPNPRSYAWS